MEEANASSMTMRPAMAGLAKFLPMPPNRHFTITMAKKEPMTACHRGMVTGRFMARSMPVITAERSETVFSFFMILSNRNSKITADRIVAAYTARARRPKMITEATAAGHRAMITSSMMFCVVRHPVR